MIRESHQLRLDVLTDIQDCNNENFEFYVKELRRLHSSPNDLDIYNRIKGDPLRSV